MNVVIGIIIAFLVVVIVLLWEGLRQRRRDYLDVIQSSQHIAQQADAYRKHSGELLAKQEHELTLLQVRNNCLEDQLNIAQKHVVGLNEKLAERMSLNDHLRTEVGSIRQEYGDLTTALRNKIADLNLKLTLRSDEMLRVRGIIKALIKKTTDRHFKSQQAPSVGAIELELLAPYRALVEFAGGEASQNEGAAK